MTKEDLKQYRDLIKEIKLLEEKRNSQETVTDVVKSSNHEFPYQETNLTIRGIDEKSNERLSNAISTRLRKACNLRADIEEFISNIDDSRTRQIFELKYIRGWSWQKISMMFGSHDESYSRKIHEKYFKNT